MLSFYASVSGGQVASEMAGFEGSQFDEVAGYMGDEERGAVVIFLRSLADTIEAAE